MRRWPPCLINCGPTQTGALVASFDDVVAAGAVEISTAGSREHTVRREEGASPRALPRGPVERRTPLGRVNRRRRSECPEGRPPSIDGLDAGGGPGVTGWIGDRGEPTMVVPDAVNASYPALAGIGRMPVPTNTESTPPVVASTGRRRVDGDATVGDGPSRHRRSSSEVIRVHRSAIDRPRRRPDRRRRGSPPPGRIRRSDSPGRREGRLTTSKVKGG